MQDTDPLAVRTNKLDLLERLSDDLAHEIKNPLHSMVINLEVLKRRVGRCGADESNTEEMLRYVGVIGMELERINRRIEFLLRLSRPDRGSESAMLGDLVNELLELIELEAVHRGVSVHYQPSEQAIPVRVPRNLVHQVILSLVLHALEGASRGDTLVLHADRDDDQARLMIRSGSSPAVPPVPDGASGGDIAEAEITSRLPAARALGEAVGGRVELLRSGAGAAPSGSPGHLFLLLSLPVAHL